MAAQANLKSTAITNLDATPILRATAGQEGGLAPVYQITGKVGPTTNGATTGGVLRAVRIPSNAVVKKVEVVQVAGTTTATFNVGLYFSDSTTDGTTAGNQGLVSLATFFASGLDTHALTNYTDCTFNNTGTGFTPGDDLKPVWEGTGLLDGAGNAMTQDPGGFFDVCLGNTATISGAATLLVRVTYTLAGQKV